MFRCRQYFLFPQPCIIADNNICICLFSKAYIFTKNFCIRKIVICIRKYNIITFCKSHSSVPCSPRSFPRTLDNMNFRIFGSIFLYNIRSSVLWSIFYQYNLPIFIALFYNTVQSFSNIFFCIIHRYDHGNLFLLFFQSCHLLPPAKTLPEILFSKFHNSFHSTVLL